MGTCLYMGTVVPLQGQLLIRIIYINVSVSELISVSEGITVECDFFASVFFFSTTERITNPESITKIFLQL